MGGTRDIWYYEIDLGRTLTKNKPIKYDELKDIISLSKERENSPKSWIVKVEDIRDYDLSAKNPNKAKEEVLASPSDILTKIGERNEKIILLSRELVNIIKS
jgi:type I restriction enzyme M protein